MDGAGEMLHTAGVEAKDTCTLEFSFY